MGVGIEGEKRRGHFERLGLLVVAVAAHLPLAVAVGAMRVDGQQFSRVIARSPANSPQGDLQPLGFRHDVLGQQAVHRHVAGHEGQPVGQLESALTEDSLLTHAGGTQCGLVDQLQRQARLDPLRQTDRSSRRANPTFPAAGVRESEAKGRPGCRRLCRPAVAARHVPSWPDRKARCGCVSWSAGSRSSVHPSGDTDRVFF